MTKHCTSCAADFDVTEADLAFYQNIAPTILGTTYAVPPPTLCPSCREQRRLAWRNERSLYRRKCAASGKEMISMYRPGTPFPVYDTSTWWSDQWDGRNFGRSYDFSRSFFEQFADLFSVTPQCNLYHSGFAENSAYTNFTLDIKNCYLSYSVTLSEDCLYVNITDKSRNCLDCLNLVSGELCYECVDCTQCYHSFYLTRCVECSDSWFCSDCIGCKNCFSCVNLHQGEYCWRNEKLSRKEYVARLSGFQVGKRQAIELAIRENSALSAVQPKRFAHILNAENCTGDRISNCRNCHSVFDVFECEDVGFTSRSYKIKNSSDGYGLAGHELMYETMSGRGYRVGCAICSYDNSDCWYIHSCFNSKNLFGCVGLNHQEYCILNKQYSQNEYESLLPQIIGEMTKAGEFGEFFPGHLSPFGYNETIAMEYYPLPKAEAEKKVYRWSDYEPDKPNVKHSILASQLPDSVTPIANEILEWAIICEKSEKPFRIVEKELSFYRKHDLPLPKYHPDERHRRRLLRRNPRQLWQRECAQCCRSIMTTYAPERPERVLCEDCYRQIVF